MKKRAFLGKGSRLGVALGSILGTLVLVGCGGSHDHDHDHDHGSHGHAHQAPHGGALGMLGNHAFQIEIVPDPIRRELDLYVLDGGAQHFVRIGAESIEGTARAGSREWQLNFRAVASEATGESVGNSSLFSASAPELVGLREFVVSFERLELLGQVYENVAIPYPEGSH